MNETMTVDTVAAAAGGVTHADLEWWDKLWPELQWTVARTMPECPHDYVVKGKTLNDEDFDRAVKVIRTFGEPGKFYRATNIYLTRGNLKWWTMGASLEETIIINRATTEVTYGEQNAPSTATGRFTIYDAIATAYDSRYKSPEAHAEDEAIRKLIARQFGAYAPSTLDVGCGTGLLLDMKITAPSLYTGLDPSQGMLNELVRKHTKITSVMPATFEEAYEQLRGQKFELVASLFGSPSYIPPDYIAKLPDLLKTGGALVTMHYREGYLPDYERDDAALMQSTAASREAMIALGDDWAKKRPGSLERFGLNAFVVSVLRG